MKMRKNICLLAAAVMLAAGLTSCGGGEEKPADTTAPAATAPAEPAQAEPAAAPATAGDIADKLRNEITYVDSLNELSAAMIEKIYGIPADKYTNGKVYIGGVSTAEEIACFDAVDEAAAAEIKTACENRIAAQIKAVESYNPNELPKLQDPVLVVKGNSVLMCLSNDNDKAKSIIG